MLLCVSFGLTNQVWNYFEFLCKPYFVFENFKEGCLKILSLGKLGLKLVFWKSISSHIYAFYFLYSMLWGMFSKNQVIFSKMIFFQIFDWSNLFFDQSKFLLNFFWASVCFDESNLNFDQSKLVNQVLKEIRFDLFKPLFQKLFKPFSLSPTRQGST